MGRVIPFDIITKKKAKALLEGFEGAGFDELKVSVSSYEEYREKALALLLEHGMLLLPADERGYGERLLAELNAERKGT